MKLFLLISIVWLISGCRFENQRSNELHYKVTALFPDTCRISSFDTVFPNKSYLRYKWDIDENLFQMTYGIEKAEFGTGYYSDCNDMVPAYQSRFHIEYANSDFIVLSRSSGSFTRKGLILPLDFTKSKFEIDEVISFYGPRNEVAYLNSSDLGNSVIVENLINRKFKSLETPDIDCGFNLSKCFEEFYFTDSTFNFSYKSNTTENKLHSAAISTNDL